MNKEEFIKVLNEAKEDEYGHLYVLGDCNNRIYFGTITTICENLMNMVSDPNKHEVYDRHFWNDDTLECKIVTVKETEKLEYHIPKRIEKLRNNLIMYTDRCIDTTFMDKIDEIIDVLNRYELMIEKGDSNE